MLIGLSKYLRGIVFSNRGGGAVLVGVTLPILIGAVGLGTEITLVIYKHRQMQLAADAGALSAATALTRGYPSNYALEADAIAGSLGFVNGVSGASVTVNNPPSSGSHSGNSSAVEVIVLQPQALTIVSFFTATAFNVSARAVALKGASGSFCLLETDSSATTGVSVSNGATVKLNQCSLAVNATGSSALSVTGGASLQAQSISVSGQSQVNNGGSITTTSGVNVNQAATADPYANVTMPTSSGCTYNSLSLGWASTVQQLSPGTYCNGISIGNGASAALSAGVYIIKSGSFSIGGGSTVTGSGVTIVLTNGTSGYASVNISNGASVTLSAPTSGATAGILFFSDRNAANSGSVSFAGGTTNTLTGALYFPAQTVSYSNGTSNTSPCTQLIAWHIQFAGGSQFNCNCASTGVSAIGGGSASQLVE
jgi:hypothetical protein